MKPKINLEKFICSYVKWNNIQDALKDQGLKCWNGEIVEIESEDERMKKEILDLVSISGNGNQFEEIKDWLEKQGKKSPFNKERLMEVAKPETFEEQIESWRRVCCIAEKRLKELLEKQEEQKPFDYEKINIQQKDFAPKSAMEAIKEEKADNQNCVKPIDKVEPKFHEGEWVIDNNGKVAIIYDLQNAGYVGHYTNGTDFVCKYDNEHLLHLWTINEATEGDVLIASDNSVFIYAGSADRYAKFYAALTKYSALNLEGGNWEDKNRVHPATKKQRDTLEKAMADAGYTFDFEKKELKKIEQNLASSAKTCKNDTLYDLLNKMPSCITVDGIDYHFVLKKTIAYMAFYEGEGEEGRDKIIFWMAGDPIVLLTAMLNKLKEEGLLE